MSWGYVAVGAGTVISGYLNKEASEDASGAASGSSEAAIAEQQRQFDLMRQDTLPYRQSGRQAMGLLSAIMGTSREQDPEALAEYQQLQKQREQLQQRRQQLQSRRGAAEERGERESFFGDAVAGGLLGTPITGLGYEYEQDEMGEELGGIDQQISQLDEQLTGLNEQIGSIEQQNPMIGQQGQLPFFSQSDIPEQFRAPETEVPEWTFDPSQVDPTQEAGYQFRLEQGQTGLENMLSKQGRTMGGPALKEAMRFNQGFATNEWQNAYNRMFQGALTDRSMAVEDYQREYGEQQNAIGQLFQLAGFGPAATATSAQAGQGMASNVASILQGNAQMQGNIAMNQAQGYNQAIQGGLGNIMTMQMANQDGGHGQGTQYNPYSGTSGNPYGASTYFDQLVA